MNQKKFDLWINESKNDFEMAEILLKSKKYNGAVFHFIQSIEKSLKAILYYHDLKPWGHSILNLLSDCNKAGIEVEEKYKIYGRNLEKHYLISRYPDASKLGEPRNMYNDKKTEEIKAISRQFLDFIIKEKNKKKEENS